MGILGFLHSIADYLLSLAKMVQTRQIGWRTVDRKTGREIREQQTLLKKLKLFLLFNPLMEYFDSSHMMRLHLHKKNLAREKREATTTSKNQIRSFVDFFRINMDDFEPSDVNAYNTFEEFFIRAHKPGSRPIHAKNDPTKAVVVADCRLVVYETVSESKEIWIKGRDFTITKLVMDKQLGPQFDDGAVASFRLSPQDYHRYHSSVSGKIKLFRSLSGDYYQVDPLALRSSLDILSRNARDYVVIESEEFGDVLFVAIGATDVETVMIHDKWQKPGNRINKGDELGLFQFGVSSIIVAFLKGRIEFDKDLLDVSKAAIAMDVEVGMSLGKAVKVSNS